MLVSVAWMPSPGRLVHPMPATVVMVPAADTARTRQLGRSLM